MKWNILAFIGGFILCFLLLRKCNNNDLKGSRTVKSDTVWIAGDSVKIIKKIPHPYPVYIKVASDSLKRLNYCDSVRFYVDSTKIDSTTLFIAQDSVNGKKMWSNRVYVSKPYFKQITTIITDSIPYPVKSYVNGFYVKGELGGGLNGLNLSVGADYVSKKRWSIGYRYGVMQKSHNIGIGYRVF